MTLPGILTAIAMGIIMVISIFGGSGAVRDEAASQWAWAILMGLVLVGEAILLIFWNHTFSNQMMYDITEGKLGVFKAVFWIFLAYHLIFQPVVNAARALR